jgi:hypothetical protein
MNVDEFKLVRLPASNVAKDSPIAGYGGRLPFALIDVKVSNK